MLTILLLAAGSSSRMRGEDKLLQEVDGQPLLRLMAGRALATGCPVLVALPPEPGPREATLAGCDLTLCHVHDADKGMAHSIRAGVAQLPGTCTAVMILPADMVELDEADLQVMVRAWQALPRDTILRGTSESGDPGHPVVFPQRDFAALGQLSGDQGARAVLQAHADRITPIPLPAHHALTDLDTPEDWQAWRAARGNTQGS